MAGPSRSDQLQKIANGIDARYPGYGSKFLAFASQHPTWSITRLEDAFAAQIALGTGGSFLQGGLDLGAKSLHNAAVSAGQGAADTAFHGLNLANWLLRIGEIVLGVILLAVGVARLTGTQNVISSAVKARVP